jgi:hypothetical protein
MVLAMSVCTEAAAPGPLAHWTFDEPDGDIAEDAMGHGRDARLFGATRVEQGEGFALRLDGEDDYVKFEGDPPLGIAGPLTVEAWIKPERGAEKLSAVFGEDLHGFLLCLSGGNHLYWYVGGGGNYVRAAISLNAWTHVAASFDGERMTLHLNGRAAAARELESVEVPRRDKFVMGTERQPQLPRFQGLIDHVRVYNRALTKEEIIEHLKNEGDGYGQTLVPDNITLSPEATEFFNSHPSPIDLEKRGDSILFANRRVGIEFGIGSLGFRVNRLYGIEDEQDFLVAPDLSHGLFDIRLTLDPRRHDRDDSGRTVRSLMGIVEEMAGEAFSVGAHEAASVSWRQEIDDSRTSLHLAWKGMSAREDTEVLDVEVTITLKVDDPLTYWHIAVENRGANYGVERVKFPMLNLAPIGDASENVLIYPQSRGRKVEAPFKSHAIRGYYTCEFEMQFEALYNKQSQSGIYLATQQSVPCLSHLEMIGTPTGIAWSPAHFPPNVAFAPEYPGYEDDDMYFNLSYDCVVGPYRGDWYDACQIYRKWAMQQSWCIKGPLTQRCDIPEWYKKAPFYYYVSLNDSATGTHSLDENLGIAADHLREWLEWADMKLPANFYSWENPVHGLSTRDRPTHVARSWLRNKKGRWAGMTGHNFYDGNYPGIEALREFSAECASLREQGGMVCPYIALEIFNQGPSENAPFAAEAKPGAIRDLYGAIRTWGGELAWQMCSWDPWWRNRLKETCELMLDNESVGGFYMDVMRGSSLPCYWTPHDHTAAGASSMTEGRHELVKVLRDAIRAKDPEAIITGENPSENMIDVIDGMLVYTLWPDHVPLLATVYQDYILRYGLELSVYSGDDSFYIDCASLFVEGTQVGRIRLKPRSAMISLQDPEHQPMIDFLEQVLGYYKNEETQQFLSFGQLMRQLTFDEPASMPMLAHHNGGEFPALESGVFRSEDGELGIFVVNVAEDELKFEGEVDPAEYGMVEGSVVDVDRISPSGAVASVRKEKAGAFMLQDSLPGRSITMYRVRGGTS